MLNLEEDPRSNHVKEMARYFDAELDEENDASTINMDNEKAKGFISSYRLFDGLTVWVYNITFYSDFRVDLDLGDDGPYYFCYNVKGHFLHRFGKKEEFAKILQNQNMIVKGSAKTSAQITFPENVELQLAVVLVDLQLLASLNIRNAKRIYSNVGEIFLNISTKLPFRHRGNIDIQSEKYASIVCANKNIDLVGGLLTEGAVLNLFASQIKAYNKDIEEISSKHSLSKVELSTITSLGPYVLCNLETILTVPKISKHYGMSAKKLQVGVKFLYGDTVGHYISNVRMGQAKLLLSTTDLNVSEVCYKVGVSSRSNFSKIFKKRYGMLPSQFKKKSS